MITFRTGRGVRIVCGIIGILFNSKHPFLVVDEYCKGNNLTNDDSHLLKLHIFYRRHELGLILERWQLLRQGGRYPEFQW